MMDTLFKTYLYKNMIQDVAKFAKKNFKDIDFDKKYWLNKAGLTTYTPVKSSFGGFALLLLGGIAGAALALAFAPKAGVEFRAEVKDKAMKFIDKSMQQPESMGEEAISLPS